jgi:hypothetical protein
MKMDRLIVKKNRVKVFVAVIATGIAIAPCVKNRGDARQVRNHWQQELNGFDFWTPPLDDTKESTRNPKESASDFNPGTSSAHNYSGSSSASGQTLGGFKEPILLTYF